MWKTYKRNVDTLLTKKKKIFVEIHTRFTESTLRYFLSCESRTELKSSVCVCISNSWASHEIFIRFADRRDSGLTSIFLSQRCVGVNRITRCSSIEYTRGSHLLNWMCLSARAFSPRTIFYRNSTGHSDRDLFDRFIRHTFLYDKVIPHSEANDLVARYLHFYDDNRRRTTSPRVVAPIC